MPRPLFLLGACAFALTACGTESTSNLFRAPNSSAGGSVAAAGFGGAGLGIGAGGTASGGAPVSDSGGASTGGLVGQGGILSGTGGFPFSGGGTATGGAAGNGGIAGASGSGGIVGDGGSSSTGGSFGDGGAGGEVGTYSSAAAADCNGTPCATADGSACCVIVSNNNGVRTVYGTCTPAGGTCTVPFSVKAHCDGPEDCARGAVCCGTLGSVPGLYTDLACVSAGDCTGAGKQVMCHPGHASTCTSNVCNPTLTLPDGYGVCG
jgi:hypothetical protein